MSPLTAAGDITGLVLLAAALVMTSTRAAARTPLAGPRVTSAQPRTTNTQPRTTNTPGQVRRQQPQAAFYPSVPRQAIWQARQPDLVEDRVPRPAALELEEAVGLRDQ